MELSADLLGVHFALSESPPPLRPQAGSLGAPSLPRQEALPVAQPRSGVWMACYWWPRLAGMLSRLAGAMTGKDWFWHVIFADDIKCTSHGPRKFENILVALLVWEALDGPITLKKCKGGPGLDWIGYWLDYAKFELG